MAKDGLDAARRAVTAFFDDRAAAQKAFDDLVAAKVDRSRITLVEGGAAPTATDPVPTPEKGIWDTVKDLFMADEDRHAYGEGLRRGGFLLSVMTGTDDAARVVEILDREGAVDMDARQSDWELEGWDPARASAALRASAGADPDPVASSPRGDAGAPMPDAPPSTLSAAEIRASVEPVGAVGPAFGTDGGAAARTRRGTVMRDADADGLRLRSYVESDGPSDAKR